MSWLQRVYPAPPMFGPRNSVVAQLLGHPVTDTDVLFDQSPLVCTPLVLADLPELWVDHVHDHVGGDT